MVIFLAYNDTWRHISDNIYGTVRGVAIFFVDEIFFEFFKKKVLHFPAYWCTILIERGTQCAGKVVLYYEILFKLLRGR